MQLKDKKHGETEERRQAERNRGRGDQRDRTVMALAARSHGYTSTHSNRVNPGSPFGCDANVSLRFVLKYILPLLGHS
jgi:hypothetical protein